MILVISLSDQWEGVGAPSQWYITALIIQVHFWTVLPELEVSIEVALQVHYRQSGFPLIQLRFLPQELSISRS